MDTDIFYSQLETDFPGAVDLKFPQQTYEQLYRSFKIKIGLGPYNKYNTLDAWNDLQICTWLSSGGFFPISFIVNEDYTIFCRIGDHYQPLFDIDKAELEKIATRWGFIKENLVSYSVEVLKQTYAQYISDIIWEDIIGEDIIGEFGTDESVDKNPQLSESDLGRIPFNPKVNPITPYGPKMPGSSFVSSSAFDLEEVFRDHDDNSKIPESEKISPDPNDNVFDEDMLDEDEPLKFIQKDHQNSDKPKYANFTPINTNYANFAPINTDSSVPL